MNEFIEQFLVECRELVEQATHDLLALEERPQDREPLDSAFRAFHTLKGAAGIVEFQAMARALHAAEDILSRARNGAEPVTAALVGDWLACLDQVERWLDAMQATGEPPADAQAAADALVARFAPGADEAPRAAPAAEPPPSTPRSADADALLAAQLDLIAGSDPAAAGGPGRIASAIRVAANVLRATGRPEAAERLEAVARAEDGHPGDVAGAIRSVLAGDATQPGDPAPAAAASGARSLRVDVERIDALVNLTAELTVAKNALAHAAAQAAAVETDPQALATMLKAQQAVLDRLVADLQGVVLKIRVLPLRQVFQPFPRLVREMVVALGKPARLVTEGEGTEADKAIVENLFEPLLHVVRNALDHGVESPEVRAAAGKPPSATIRISAARAGEQVLVEVEDDGCGLDLARIRDVALARGVVTRDQLAAMADQAIAGLVFAPGFSTARTVTDVSGRGVGMDAVRRAVESLGGRVTLDSRAGEGTRVRFVLPFTLMMNRVMTVEAGGQLFGIPMEALVETVRLDREQIAPIGAARAFVLRDRTLPLINLADAVGDAGPNAARDHAHVAVVSAGGALGGLEVDRLGEPLDVMLKPMNGLLAGTPGVAGTTLLGDGRVLIVLDVLELLR
jgi:two-component system chemotaxis sensor kinase CheA